jgi:Photosynthesis system II assembly factor YCF48
MPELPNLLRQQLSGAQNGSQNSSSPHPDADTITAYVEQSLPTAERQTMASHLAVCEPCREVVALSLPELELVPQTVIKPAPVPAWRRLFTPAFGLAASVAAMAIIAFAVLQLSHRTSPSPAQQSQAKVIVPANSAPTLEPSQSTHTAAPALVDQPSPASSAPANTSEAKASQSKPASAALENLQLAQAQLPQAKDLKSRQRQDAPADKSSAPQPVLTAGLQKKDYLNTNFFANSDDTVVLGGQNNAGQSQNVPAAPQPQTAAAARAFSYSPNTITSFSDIPANAITKSNTRLLTPTPGPERFSCTICKVATATAHTLRLRSVAPALRASTLGTSALGGPGMFSSTLERTQSAEVSAAPAKAEGGSLANSDSFSAGALGASSYQSSTEPAQWKVAGGKLVKSGGQSQWEDAYPAAAIEFSFVNARGKDIWAGGSNATLIHSRDAGSTWETVKLGDAATGSIVSIIAGTFNVQVKTSDNQLWSSSDGGKTWAFSSE